MICVKKGIFAIVGVAIIIIVVFAVPTQTETPPPGIQDSTEINDESTVGVGDEPESPQISDEGSIGAGLKAGETPTISDSAEVKGEEGINVGETPTISDSAEVEADEGDRKSVV